MENVFFSERKERIYFFRNTFFARLAKKGEGGRRRALCNCERNWRWLSAGKLSNAASTLKVFPPPQTATNTVSKGAVAAEEI